MSDDVPLFVTVLRYLLGLLVVVGIIRLPPRLKPAGILAALFLLLLPYLRLDPVDAWLADHPSPELSLLIALMVGAAFFTERPRWRPDS